MASGTGILQSVYVYLLSAVSDGMCLSGLLFPWPGFQPFRVKPFRRKVYHDLKLTAYAAPASSRMMKPSS